MGDSVIIKGRCASLGYTIGEVLVYKRHPRRPAKKKIDNVKNEIKRYESVRLEAIAQLENLYNESRKKSLVSADIFMAQSMILQDEAYNAHVINCISRDLKNAEWAVSDTSRFFYEIFESVDDETVRAKITDLKDVTNKLISLLSGNDFILTLKRPSILAAEEITPSDMIHLNKENLLGIIMKEGSKYSHSVILAKAMGIPVVLGIDVQREWNKKLAIVDGNKGIVYISPESETIDEFKKLIEAEKEQKKLLEELIGKDAVTGDGRKVTLLANIGDLEGAKRAMANDCEGIGLMRTEFLFLNRDKEPSEEEHYLAYKEIVEECQGKSVVFRTFDLGADKKLAFSKDIREENPALGLRAIRACISNKEMFKNQIKGILRAACHGEVSILYPMITSNDELDQIEEIVNEARMELDERNEKYGDVSVGIMIETPAAAIISDSLAKKVDFFSVGTNDLTQYTLAIDRQNSGLVQFYNPYHEAVLRLIEITVRNAHEAGIRVAICGELAADTTVTRRLIELGVDELSVSSKNILPLRNYIRSL